MCSSGSDAWRKYHLLLLETRKSSYLCLSRALFPWINRRRQTRSVLSAAALTLAASPLKSQAKCRASHGQALATIPHWPAGRKRQYRSERRRPVIAKDKEGGKDTMRSRRLRLRRSECHAKAFLQNRHSFHYYASHYPHIESHCPREIANTL